MSVKVEAPLSEEGLTCPAPASERAAADAPNSDAGDIEERCFSAALICLEGHFAQLPPMGPLTAARVGSIISRILEKTHTLRAISLTSRSVGPLPSLNDSEKNVSPQESTAVIIVNHVSLKEDIGTLIKLMHIARNLLVNTQPEVPQDICAAARFDQMVYQTIVLCTNVTSKDYDGEVLDDAGRLILTDVSEIYKKLLVTALQQAHNWTAKHDRNKMSFWCDVLFDEEDNNPTEPDEGAQDGSGFRPEIARQQIQHWLDRNSRMCDRARQLLQAYYKRHSYELDGHQAGSRPIAWNWSAAIDPPSVEESTNPVWKADETDKVEQDRAYGRVSREIDTWWLGARDPNYEEWVVEMPTVEFAQTRKDHCKNNLVQRYMLAYQGRQRNSRRKILEADGTEHNELECLDCRMCREYDHVRDCFLTLDMEQELDAGCKSAHLAQGTNVGGAEKTHSTAQQHVVASGHAPHTQSQQQLHQHNGQDEYGHEAAEEGEEGGEDEYGEEEEEEEEEEDDEADDDLSFGEVLSGLLTDVPNVLDPKQIEALHMIVKSCTVDTAGSGLTRAGENLQKTRCRMFLALDCGKSLLRELLVFLAVWDKDEESLVFQVTTQIVEAIHHNALIPYAWNSLRLPKDIISPAQTVLLRLLNNVFRAKTLSSTAQSAKDTTRELKLVHFFFSFFRSRIVPELLAVMHFQAQIREQKCDPSDFPVGNWDMERSKDGLAQYLEFLTTVAENAELRAKLIEWEVVCELIAILSGLEAAVQKKPLVEVPKRAPQERSHDPRVERPYSTEEDDGACPLPPPPPPPLQEPAHKFPWAGVKGQIFTILAILLQPPAGQSSPGNAQVQSQMVTYNGIVPLLNSCAYDDHNPYAKERVTICLKWLLDGCEAANNFFRELVSMAPQPILRPRQEGATVGSIKMDSIQGEVRVQVRSKQTNGTTAAAAATGEGEDKRAQGAFAAYGGSAT